MGRFHGNLLWIGRRLSIDYFRLAGYWLSINHILLVSGSVRGGADWNSLVRPCCGCNSLVVACVAVEAVTIHVGLVTDTAASLISS